MRTRIGIALVAVLAVIAIIAGVAAKKLQSPAPIMITDPGSAAPASLSSDPVSPSDQSPKSSLIFVHVAGAVKKPSLYQLAAGSRLFQAMKAAGGATPDADLDAVNLAEKLSDGEKVYVPTRDQVKSSDILASANAENDIGEHSMVPDGGHAGGKASEGSRSGAGSNKLTSPSQGKVDINTADAEELQRLPGVGPAMAARILAFRNSAGRFRKPEDLMEVSGIGPKKFAKMRPFLKVN